jgi:hypothetical protein
LKDPELLQTAQAAGRPIEFMSGEDLTENVEFVFSKSSEVKDLLAQTLELAR